MMTPDHIIARNYRLLAAVVAAFFCFALLGTAMGPMTLLQITDNPSLSGIPGAIFLLSGAAVALPAGKAMDRFGRVPIMLIGFALGIVGSGLIIVALLVLSMWLVLLGFVLMGTASAAIILARIAGGDMVRPEKRGHGIAKVMSGGIVGAIVGPALYFPLFHSGTAGPRELIYAWAISGGCLVIGMVLAYMVHPDPRTIGIEIRNRLNGGHDKQQSIGKSQPLRELLRDLDVRAALACASAVHSLKVSWMSLMGVIMTTYSHHSHDIVLVAISIHFLGSFALVLISGKLVDYIGQERAMITGTGLFGVCICVLGVTHDAFIQITAMFLLGVAWNISYVAATVRLTMLAPLADRAKLIGFSDLLASLFGAVLTALGGVVISKLGVEQFTILSVLILSAAYFYLVQVIRRRIVRFS